MKPLTSQPSNLKLSIIIVNWNTKQLLEQCLNSLVRSAKCEVRSPEKAKKPSSQHSALRTHNFEIIVVDNGSTDGSVELVKKLQVTGYKLNKKQPSTFNLQLIPNKTNLGFAKANNQALEQAQGEYILLLNSDTRVHPGAIEKLVDYLENHPDTAVSPLLVLPDGRPQSDYYMRFPNLWQILLYHHPVMRPVVMKSPLKRLICQAPRYEPFEVDQLPGTALMAPRRVWQKVGNLDPEFQFFWEDVDWSWRAKNAGVRRVVVPAALVTHVGGASWKKKLDRDKTGFYRQFFASLLLFVRKHYRPGRLVLFKAALAVNFLTTGKVGLLADLLKGNLKQKKLWA